jgi:hypothetical protein
MVSGAKPRLGQVLLLVFINFLITTPVEAHEKLELANNGASKFVIVLKPSANINERKAASLFQDIFYRVTQVKLPIGNVEKSTTSFQVIIGPTNTVNKNEIAQLGTDGFFIRRINNTVVLTGGSRKGSLYAVTTFLEEYLGCQAFTQDFIKVPNLKIVSLPPILNRREIPSFSYRMTFFPDAQNFEYCDWRKLNNFYEGWGMWVHSFDQLLSPGKYFRGHPEYFALRNGERKPTQPCLSNPDVFNIIVKTLRDTISRNPTAPFWSVSQNDNQEHCQCDVCSRVDRANGSPQGSLLSFVNRVAKLFPGKTICTLAYQYSEQPPKLVVPEKNVMVMLCTEAFQDRAKPVSQFKAFDSVFSKWSLLTKQIFIWDYVANFHHFLLPFPNLQVMQPNIRYFASKGPKYLFLQGHGIYPAEFSELKCYVISKLMWNKDANVNAAIDTFLVNYYGAQAAFHLRKYIDLSYRNSITSGDKIEMHGLPGNYFNGYLSASNISQYKQLFERALSATAQASDYYKRISKDYASILYAELEAARHSATRQASLPEAEQLKYDEVLDRWYGIMKQARLVYLDAASRPVETYYTEYKRMLPKAQKRKIKN